MKSNELEKLVAKELPLEYKGLLRKFNDFLVVKEKGAGKIFYFDPICDLLEKEDIGKGKRVYFFEKLKYLLKDESLTSGHIFCHSDNNSIEIARINSSIIIASYDGAYLYFDTIDNFSVWEFWVDEGTVGKLATTLKDFLSKYDIEVAE